MRARKHARTARSCRLTSFLPPPAARRTPGHFVMLFRPSGWQFKRLGPILGTVWDTIQQEICSIAWANFRSDLVVCTYIFFKWHFGPGFGPLLGHFSGQKILLNEGPGRPSVRVLSCTYILPWRNRRRRRCRLCCCCQLQRGNCRKLSRRPSFLDVESESGVRRRYRLGREAGRGRAL